MTILRFFAFSALLGVSALGAQTTVPVFNYSYTLNNPHSAYADSGNELIDGVAAVPAWGHGDFSGDGSSFVGWDSGPIRIRFNFGSQVAIDSASFYFADSDGAAGVYYPNFLQLWTESGSLNLHTTPSFSNAATHSYTAAATTFSFGSITTDHLFLDITPPIGGWTMMTEATFSTSAIPEPSTYAALAGGAMLGFALWRRRRRAMG